MCARVLALRGHEVTVFDRNPKRLGCFTGSNIAVATEPDELGGIDVLVETTGDPHALRNMIDKSMPGAAMLLLGVPMAHEQFTFRDMVAYDKTIVGSVGREQADVEEALELLPRLELEPFLQHVVPFERFTDAWQSVRKDEYLKTMLEIDPE
jgi:threonine dehydrogenase-like Zn-dependent dehydrogenase